MKPTALPTGVIAVVRVGSQREAETICRGLIAAGIDALELTLTTPGAIDLIALLGREHGMVGAGTVRSSAQATSALEAGARFLVSPSTSASVIETALAAHVPVVPGALTPTEIDTAWTLGATAVKLFPIGAVGGPAYLRSIREPFPDIPFVVSGGIQPTDVRAYLDAGCHAVCLGGALIDRDAAAAGDIAACAAHAAGVLSSVGLPG